jgi:hypothetical protein
MCSAKAQKGPGDKSEVSKNTATPHAEVNTADQGDTANIRQNTTNKSFFQGRRVKKTSQAARAGASNRCRAELAIGDQTAASGPERTSRGTLATRALLPKSSIHRQQ